MKYSLATLSTQLVGGFASVAIVSAGLFSQTVIAQDAIKPLEATQAAPTKNKVTAKAKKVKKTKRQTSKQVSSQALSFAKADVDKVGKLTKKQAFNAKMYDVDRYFFDMDTDIDGYVTLDELNRWKANPVRTAPRPRGDRLDRFVAGDTPRK